MSETRDHQELVQLMSRYASIADTRDFDELPRSVFADEITADFRSLGAPLLTTTCEAWCRQTARAFAGWAATHHAITNHRIEISGDRARVRAHARVEHWAPPEIAAGGPNCWLVVGFYDNGARRTPVGWRLESVRLTVTYEENSALLAMVASGGAGG